MPACPPTGEPLVGRFVRLDPVQPDDAEGLHAVLTDPAVYTQGFIMRPAPVDLDETRARVAKDVAAREAGRTAYTVRLVGDTPSVRRAPWWAPPRSATSTSSTSGCTSAGRCTAPAGGAPR